ncbi:hypothetical protein KVR01_013695 [Diaporthe batatas]|uniref:uncharacterized protein n=1 Tax=Diaporthe batatas TaxID=748121 RepID=UPI001D037B3C|nr:uncharacterized protein KVR01_013695 [Diaporthe batatas]KAG8156461.1 hypothetical protein KVR01_013695 [Diaporthe batatas]
MKFTLSAAAVLALATGALSAAVETRQSASCGVYKSATSLPNDSDWGGFALCCDYLGPSGGDVAGHCCDRNGVNTGSGAPACE